MPAGTYFAIAELVLRGLDAAPEFVDALERLWRTISENPGAPGHLEAAVTAAVEHTKVHAIRSPKTAANA